jgi:hypothetical protein
MKALTRAYPAGGYRVVVLDRRGHLQRHCLPDKYIPGTLREKGGGIRVLAAGHRRHVRDCSVRSNRCSHASLRAPPWPLALGPRPGARYAG